jgi:hypothetical protein
VGSTPGCTIRNFLLFAFCFVVLPTLPHTSHFASHFATHFDTSQLQQQQQARLFCVARTESKGASVQKKFVWKAHGSSSGAPTVEVMMSILYICLQTTCILRPVAFFAFVFRLHTLERCVVPHTSQPSTTGFQPPQL